MWGDSARDLFGSLTPRVVDSSELPTLLDLDPATVAETPSVLASAMRMLGALALVLALLILTVWLLKRFGSKITGLEGPQGKGVQILHQKPLGGRRTLTVVKWEGRKILLGITGEHITALASEPDGVSLEDEQGFEAELTEAMQRGRRER